MTACTELARRLGKAIADSPEATAYRAARDELAADADLSQTLEDYQQQARKIAQLEAEQKPVEVDDKHKLADLQAKIASNDLLKEWMRLQADYSELWNKVNRAMLTPILQSQGPEEAEQAPQAVPPQPPTPGAG